jgi:hypothetical protein
VTAIYGWIGSGNIKHVLMLGGLNEKWGIGITAVQNSVHLENCR